MNENGESSEHESLQIIRVTQRPPESLDVNCGTNVFLCPGDGVVFFRDGTFHRFDAELTETNGEKHLCRQEIPKDKGDADAVFFITSGGNWDTALRLNRYMCKQWRRSGFTMEGLPIEFKASDINDPSYEIAVQNVI